MGADRRTYQLSIPPGYDGTQKLPLVLTFHGRGEDAESQLNRSRFAELGDREDFVVAAPVAVDGLWDLPTTPEQQTSDTRFVFALLDSLESELCIDNSREYASGYSLGSAMTLVLACLPQRRFAAFGGVGAGFYRAACNPEPAPIVYFHGTEDFVVPYEGGPILGSPKTGPLSKSEPVEQIMSQWAQHNGCSSGPDHVQIEDVSRLRWSDCRDAADVDLYRVDGGGHTWPGSTESFLGATTDAVDATEVTWQFFQQHQLPTSG